MTEDPKLSLNAAVGRIGSRVGIVPDTLRGWAKQRRIDTGNASGTTSDDAARIKELERENRELKRANEILLAASSQLVRTSLTMRRLVALSSTTSARVPFKAPRRVAARWGGGSSQTSNSTVK